MKGMVNMKNFEKWLENSGLGYYVEVNEKGNKTFLINKYNGIIVYCIKGTRQAQVKQADGSWIAYSYKKLIAELEA